MISPSSPPPNGRYDIVIRGGTIYDGTNRPGVAGDLAIRDGRVVAHPPGLGVEANEHYDATGCWVVPGLLDVHTHYDAEIEAMPGLEESVRHGVTTCVMGNCSLSTALGKEKDLLDLFCRVESLPRDVLGAWLKDKVTWHDVRDYYDHLEQIPIGPNVASFIGHSNVRFTVMGMDRSLHVHRAEPREIAQMQGIVREAMEAGYIGLSIDMLPWHRMDGEPFKGISVPSQQAHPHEYRKLGSVVRHFGRVLQATPSALTKSTILALFRISSGLFRPPLRTTIVAAMDIRTNRSAYKLATTGAALFNRCMRANIRWQSLAEPFLNYCDGVFTPLFEEFASGAQAITATSQERRALFADATFRRRFRQEWEDTGERIFHRELDDMWIIGSPDPSHVGKSFAQIAREESKEPIVMLMDLFAAHDTAIRWKTVVTNDRDPQRQWLFAHPTTIPGFNDSGAHARNMAFQDGGLQMLRQVLLHPEVLPLHEAIHKLTKLSADWLGIDAGSIQPGDWADVVVIDPEKLKTGLGEPIEQYDERLQGAMRMVKRSDGVVRQVFIGGQVAYENGQFRPDFGQRRYGRLLRSTRNAQVPST